MYGRHASWILDLYWSRPPISQLSQILHRFAAHLRVIHAVPSLFAYPALLWGLPWDRRGRCGEACLPLALLASQSLLARLALAAGMGRPDECMLLGREGVLLQRGNHLQTQME